MKALDNALTSGKPDFIHTIQSDIMVELIPTAIKNQFHFSPIQSMIK